MNSTERIIYEIVRNLNPYLSGRWLCTDAAWNCGLDVLNSQVDAGKWNFVKMENGFALLPQEQKADEMVALAYSQMVEEITRQARQQWDNTACIRLFNEAPELYRFVCMRLRERFDPSNKVTADNEKHLMGRLVIHHVVSAYRREVDSRMLNVPQEAYFSIMQKYVNICTNEAVNVILSAVNEYA